MTRPDAPPGGQLDDTGIRQLTLPTPFPVGPVNLYLIEDEPLTLIDTGPGSATALDQLEQQLAVHGYEVEDLELVVLTHQHSDHTGLLEIVTRRSGAEVAAFAPLQRWLGDYRASCAAEDEYAQALLARHGVPQDIVAMLGVLSAVLHSYGSRGTVTRPLRDGDELKLRDRSLQVAHRPGHSPSDLTFWDAERRILIAGDHLLSHISSNPVIHRPLSGEPDAPRPTPLVDYIASLERTRALPARLVVGGHGEAVANHVELIDERLRLHRRRAGQILRMLSDGPLTAHQIAAQMWGGVAVTQAFLTVSEVLGHLDLLLADGKIAESDDGGVSRFEAA